MLVCMYIRVLLIKLTYFVIIYFKSLNLLVTEKCSTDCEATRPVLR